ncbi:ABC transporter ATP-binding protein [Sulfitobacter sp. EhC04]|uniref:ABC transporter ATP-binding protein n=1 Tax=Sulfitobacter sp. EhC04 TaxID=1849168 RepID=UPI0007F46F3C|nr:ABC transporter ATP-binding protein [Sulfitobacter sp. EhC04]OAN75158.1 ABC transporter ATP-binding protein [Sulfitobacter sp. EhC04]
MTVALSVENAGFRYRDKWALRNVSLTVEGGTFCALLGPNGAGKSTLFSLLTHLNRPREGAIYVQGCDLDSKPLAVLARLGVVFQQPTLDLETTVQNNLTYFAGLHGFHGADARKRIGLALERMDMQERAHEKVRDLNGGHRRRMELARALIHDPDVLLLDEPTVGLDHQARRDITDYAHQLAKDGKAVLWATHLVDEILDDDQVVILHQGRVLANGLSKAMADTKSLADFFLELTARQGGE